LEHDQPIRPREILGITGIGAVDLVASLRTDRTSGLLARAFYGKSYLVFFEGDLADDQVV